MPAVPEGDKLYLNIGDMLMQLSNGELIPMVLLHQQGTETVLSGFYPSATHRVTIPETLTLEGHGKQKTSAARYSIPYFVSPDLDGVVFPQPSCTDAENPSRYEKTTFAAYQEFMSKWQYETAGAKS